MTGTAGRQDGEQLTWIVSVSRVSNLARRAFLAASRFYLKGTIGGSRLEWTSKVVRSKSGLAEWTEDWQFQAEESATLDLKLYLHREIVHDQELGGLRATLGSLQSLSSPIERDLLSADGTVMGRITFSVRTLQGAEHQATALDTAVEKARLDVSSVRMISGKVAEAYDTANDTVVDIISDGGSIEDVWQPLLGKLDAFVSIMDVLTEVHPYAKLAWTVLSAAYQVYKAQTSRDQKLTVLVAKMNTVYDILIQARPLQELKTHESVLKRISQQTIECGHFISSYAKQPIFWQRMIRQAISSDGANVDGFETSFDSLLQELDGQLNVETEIMVLRMVRNMERMESDISLNFLDVAHGAGYRRSKQCLPGTRVKLLEDITEWAVRTAEDSPRVLLLSGPAGTGKSTIAHTIAARLDDMKRLGSSFCFDRNESAQRSSQRLLPTTARNLADFDPAFKIALWQKIGDKFAVRDSIDLSEQFDNFILGPAKEIVMNGPILIMIDGLDEAGEPRNRRQLLSILSTRVAELPRNFKFLITAREEKDIGDAFALGKSAEHRSMPTLDNDKELLGDLTTFIRFCLRNVPDCSTEERVGKLVEMSDGLFQWAHVACDFIVGDGLGGELPEERYDALVEHRQNLNEGGEEVYLLDGLYRLVLPSQIDFRKKAARSRFTLTMGLVLNTFEPLPLATVGSLAKHVPGLSDSASQDILCHLGTFLSGVSDRTTPIKPLHSSFREFLTINGRGGDFFIGDFASHHTNLAESCLEILNSELCFNMCKLETSYRFNRDIPDLKQRVGASISSSLSYACRYWGLHTSRGASAWTAGLVENIKILLESKLLFWFEALSLLGAVNMAARSLYAIIPLLDAYDKHLCNLAQDALQFVRRLFRAMSDSAPHIYLSALMAAPSSSLVQQVYLRQYPQTARLFQGQRPHWPAANVLRGHASFVISVCFSHDSKQIVSGSADNTIRLWDTETGEPVGVPLEGHVEWVTSVAFSHDSKRIVSGSRDSTIRIWDVETGEQIGETLVGHTDTIWAVAVSHDSKRIVSGSRDRTIRVWDADTGKPAGEPLEGHQDTVWDVSFSHDSTRIVSSSGDKTIRIWDAEHLKPLGEPFEGQTDEVWAVSYSDDGKRIVSGSADNTIRIWDAETGKPIGEPLKGHSDTIWAVSFSHDGKQILSGSEDGTIRIWDAVSGESLGAPLDEHSQAVLSVAFSHDSKRIVSGSADNTIRIWDAETGEPAGGRFLGHSAWVTSVAFSPDSERIASGSRDNTIRLWDIRAGEPFGEPLSEPLDKHADVSVMSLSHDGKLLAYGSEVNIQTLDLETGKPVSHRLEGHTDRVSSLAFSQDAKRLVSGSSDGTIRVWNVETGELVGAPHECHSAVVISLAFSHDKKRIVSGSADMTIGIWDAETSKPVGAPLRGHTDSIWVVSFSHDSKRILSGSGDNTIRIWDAETGTILGTPLEGHTGLVWSVSFSHDDRQIVSGSEDKTIRIWDSETGECIGDPLAGHADAVLFVAFLHDCKQIVSVSRDSTIRIWDVGTPGNGNINAFCREDSHHLKQPYLSESSMPARLSIHMDSGWIKYNDADNFLWLPPELLGGLCLPPCRQVIPKDSVVWLDLSRMVHGARWAECYQPMESEVL